MGGGDGPVGGDDAAAAPVAPVVAAVSDAALPRPRVRQRLDAADDTRVLGRHAASAAPVVRNRHRLVT